MTTLRNARRDLRQRGNTIVLALIVLSALLMAGTLMILKVQRGARASSQARSQSVAHFAAESGISAGMEFLRTNVAPTTFFSAFVTPSNSTPVSPMAIPGNAAIHLDPDNVFSGQTEMSYEVSLRNNLDDPGFAAGDDTDGRIALRSVGKGPGSAMVIVEVVVDGSALGPLEVQSWRSIQ